MSKLHYNTEEELTETDLPKTVQPFHSSNISQQIISYGKSITMAGFVKLLVA